MVPRKEKTYDDEQSKLHPQHVKAKQLIRDGLIGEVKSSVDCSSEMAMRNELLKWREQRAY